MDSCFDAVWFKETFTTRKKMDRWLTKHGSTLQWKMIPSDNGLFTIEYKRIWKL